MLDVDSDTDLDIYVVNGNNEQNKLWINDGSGSFTANDIAGDTGSSRGVSFGDVDGDTDLDIYVANAAGQQNKLWINDGSGSFTANDIAGDTGFSAGAIILDVDGDAYLDIYTTNSGQNNLWINDGSGNFTANDISGDASGGTSINAIAVDIDGDNDLDIYVVNSSDNQNNLWINDGSGNFTANDISGDLGYSSGATAGDIDGDTDIDIYVANGGGGGQNKLWINTTPSLNDFVTTWKTDNTGSSNSTSITIPTTGSGYNYDVDWDNDGTFDEFGLTGDVTHDFGVAGTYTIRIQGDFPRIYFNNTGDRQKILSVDQWGNQVWTSLDKAFYGARNIQILATDAPDLSGMTNLSYVFQSTYSFNQDISHWDVSGITDMTGAFYGAFAFNQPLDNWDVSNVTNMTSMFGQAFAFSQPLNSWDVSNVTNMTRMFNNSSFNGTISSWDVSNVTSMSSMFATNAYFNQDISGWNVSSVTNPGEMFYNSTAFNQPLNSWDTSSFGNTSYMFFGATSFNQDLNLWNTASTTSMVQMFYNATSFNGNISTWDVSNVTNMRGMFEGASNFNGNISTWDTSSVSEIWNMFKNATSFDQDLGGWDVADVTNAYEMFNGVTLSTSNYDSLLIGWNSQLLQNSVYFDGGNSLYCAGTSARSNMISSDSWIITDGGGGCPSEITYDTTTFVESIANDGTISTTATLTLSGDTFTTTSGPMAGTLDYAISNVPSGLTFSVVGTSSTTATVTLTGLAAAHENINDISNLGLEFTDNAFTGGAAAGITGYSNQTLAVDFNDAASLSYSVLTLREPIANDGSVTGGIEVTLTGDTFTNSTSTLTLGVDYTVANVPLGLTMVVTGTSATTVGVGYSGNALAHEDINDVSNIELTFLDAAFTSGSASLVGGYSNTSLGIDFLDAKTFSYDTETFAEASANDGTVDTTITITLSGDTFATPTLLLNTHYTATNVPSGLTLVVTPTSATTITLNLTGSAASHADANDISNLTLTFLDSIFTGGSASLISGYSNTSLVVDFEDESVNTNPYTPPPICSLKAPSSISLGEILNLAWNVTWPGRASSFYYKLSDDKPKISEYEGMHSPISKGIAINSLLERTTFTLAAINQWGATICDAEVEVIEPQPKEIYPELEETIDEEKIDGGTEVEETTSNEEVIIEPTPEPEPQVCLPYINSYIQLNNKANNPEDVTKLETFLNTYEGEELAVNGIYERKDYKAVIRFQEKYNNSVLEPWKLIKEGDQYQYVPTFKEKAIRTLSKGTGYVYISTRLQINNLYCENQGLTLQDEIEILPELETNQNSNLQASVGSSSFAKAIWNFFKDLIGVV